MHAYLLPGQAANSLSFDELTIKNVSFGFVKIDWKEKKMQKCLLHCTISPDNHKVLSNSWGAYFQIKHGFCCCFKNLPCENLSLCDPVCLICLLCYLARWHLFFNICWLFRWKTHIGCSCLFFFSQNLFFFLCQLWVNYVIFAVWLIKEGRV